MEGCSCIAQPKRHDSIVVCPFIYDEGCLFLVIWVQTDLIIPRMYVHEAQLFTAGASLYQVVHRWKGVDVPIACGIEVCEIHTHSPPSIWLPYNGHICQPPRVPNWSNETDHS